VVRLAACAAIGALAVGLATAVAIADGRAPTVVLISLDGTRPADVTPETMPHLASLSARGAVAERMIGVVPTNTFPSHASLATGVAPERHGLVNNVFVDPERGVFRKQDIVTWLEVEPIWSLLERAGIPTASYYWIGSEGAWPGGRAPSEWKRFSPRTSERKKVDRILEWLGRPPGEQPRLITSWFHGADHAGHHDGPGTPEAADALRRQDAEIGRLIEAVVAQGRAGDTTLLFVSDHGMARAERHVDLAAALREQDDIRARVYGIGGFATVLLRDADREAGDVAERVVARARALGLQAAVRTEAPADWRVDHPRFGDVAVRAPPGTALVYAGLDLEGWHGYDPGMDDMAAIFMAFGRGARPGAALPVVRSVDVAPTVLALLGRPAPEWMEGSAIEPLITAAEAAAAPGASAGTAEDAASGAARPPAGGHVEPAGGVASMEGDAR